MFVKLQPYRQQSLIMRGSQKLAPKFFGPYKISDKHGKVAYELELPSYSKIHPVFHVSQLKRLVGDASATTQLPSVLQDTVTRVPEACLGRKMVKRHGKAATMILVKWEGETDDMATWEFLFDLQKKFPSFSP